MKFCYLLSYFVCLTGVLAQYVPEPYGWSCYRMAANRGWPECAALSGKEQKKCLCTMPDFIRMTEECLQKAVVNATDPSHAADLARRYSLCGNSVEMMSHLPSKGSIQGPESKAGNVNASISFEGPKTSSYNVEDLPEYEFIDPISDDEIYVAMSTAEWRMANDRRGEGSGAALVGFWGFAIVGRYIVHLLGRIIPPRYLNKILLRRSVRLLRARVLYPALGKHSHCKPWLSKLSFRLPTRSSSIVLVLFTGLNYALVFSMYPHTQYNFVYPTESQQYNKSLAIRCAFMIMWKLPLVFAFSSANNILIILGHPWSMDTFITFHRWLARLTFVDIIIHGVAISCVKAEQGLYASIWKVHYWQWGIVGIILPSIMIVQSLHFISTASYEAFKVVHNVLAAVFVAATWYHVVDLPYGIKHVYAVIAIWGFDHLARIIRLMMAARVEAKVKHISDSVSILVFPKPPRIYATTVKRNPSYVYMHLWQKLTFWQAHPFTLFSYTEPTREDAMNITKTIVGKDGSRTVTHQLEKNDSVYVAGSLQRFTTNTTASTASSSQPVPEPKESDSLVMVIKRRNGITKTISTLPEGPITVTLDGPYLNFFPLCHFDRLICLAGGVGISAHLSQIQCLLASQSRVKVKLFWAVSDMANAQWAFGILSKLSTQIEIEIFLSHSDFLDAHEYKLCPPVNARPMKCSEIVKTEIAVANEELADVHGSIAIFACGPSEFNDDARAVSCWAIENSVAFVDYFEESFTW